MSSATIYGLLTLFMTAGSTVVSNGVAGWVGSKFAPLNKIPFLNKLPPSVMKNIKRLTKVATKSLPLSDIAYSIIFPIMIFLMVYLSNTIILQLVILRDCKRMNSRTLKVAREKALAGAIPTLVVSIIAMVVLWILARIPLFTVPIAVAYALNGVLLALIVINLATNFLFGGALGVTLARRDGCSDATDPSKDKK